MIRGMGKGDVSIPMEMFMKECGKMIKLMGKERTLK